MRVKYLAQEHNAVPRPGLEPGLPDPESSALTIRPPRLPQAAQDIHVNYHGVINQKHVIACLLFQTQRSQNITCFVCLMS